VTPGFVGVLFGTICIVLAAMVLVGQALRRDPWWLFRRQPRNALAWILALLIASCQLGRAWNSTGHVTCDFACQWLLGRMFATGQAGDLYLIKPQRAVLAEGYQGADLDKLVRDILWKGQQKSDEGIEGPLYPPTHGLLMMPFAVLDPRAAHAVLTLVYVQLVFVSGLLIGDLTRWRIQGGEAVLVCLVFPNFSGGIVLGQNSSLTLALVTAGWWLWAKDRPLLAGLTWGLLAYKPVFAVAVVCVPVLWLNVRCLAGMASSGAGLVLATLPWCGWHSWVRWLSVGQNAAEIYARDRNWIWMSRDLIGLPRRQMWDWEHFWRHLELVTAQREWDPATLQLVDTSWSATVAGLALWLGVWAVTFAVGFAACWRYRRLGLFPAFGPQPAFVWFGFLLSVYHYMHYDMQVQALPMCLFLAAADRLRRPSQAALVALNAALAYCHLDLSIGHGSLRIPFELFLVLAAWLWTGMASLTALWEPLATGKRLMSGEAKTIDGAGTVRYP